MKQICNREFVVNASSVKLTLLVCIFKPNQTRHRVYQIVSLSSATYTLRCLETENPCDCFPVEAVWVTLSVYTYKTSEGLNSWLTLVMTAVPIQTEKSAGKVEKQRYPGVVERWDHSWICWMLILCDCRWPHLPRGRITHSAFSGWREKFLDTTSKVARMICPGTGSFLLDRFFFQCSAWRARESRRFSI